MMTLSKHYLTLILFAVAFGTVGCNAFNDHDKENQILHDLGVFDQPAEGEEAPADEAPAEAPSDEEGEAPVEGKVVCNIIAAVQVTMASEVSDVVNSRSELNGRVTITSAQLLDDNTTMVSTGSDDVGTLKITIQKQADGSFGLCDAVFEQDQEQFTVTGGTVTIEHFNKDLGSKMLNSGSFSLQVSTTPSVTKATQLLLGKAAQEPISQTVEGRYYADKALVLP